MRKAVQALDVSPRIGHLHVAVDGASWVWADTGGGPIIVAGLPEGPHKVEITPSTQTISLWVKANHSAQQQRTYTDARGNSLGRSTLDSQGTVTNTDSRGRTPLLGGDSETFRKLRAPEGFRSPVGKPGRAHRFCGFAGRKLGRS